MSPQPLTAFSLFNNCLLQQRFSNRAPALGHIFDCISIERFHNNGGQAVRGTIVVDRFKYGLTTERTSHDFRNKNNKFNDHAIPNNNFCFSTSSQMLSASLSSNSVESAAAGVVMQEYDEEQVRLMEERCIVVDENDVNIGSESKKNCHLMTRINEGLLHRAFSVFLFNSEGKLLLQQRADEKITFPGYWTNTCCSHPLAIKDEIVEEDQLGAKRAAQRKLAHELGISADQVPLEKFQFLTRIHYLAGSDGLWGEHEIDYIFIVQADIDVNPSPNEVKAVKYVTKEELMDIFATASDKNVSLTPWFKLIVERFLYGWWDHLDSLESHKDTVTVHRM